MSSRRKGNPAKHVTQVRYHFMFIITVYCFVSNEKVANSWYFFFPTSAELRFVLFSDHIDKRLKSLSRPTPSRLMTYHRFLLLFFS